MTHNIKRLLTVIAWTGLLMGIGCEYHTQAPGTNEALEEKIKALQEQIADNSVKAEGVGEINEGPQTITPTEPATADTTPPSVLKVSPNSIGSWGLLKAIVVEFDEAVDVGSLPKDALLLSPSTVTADSPLILSIVTGDGNKRLTLILSGALQPGTPYTAVLQAEAIKDLAGNAMTGDYTWSFTIPAPQAPAGASSNEPDATDPTSGSPLDNAVKMAAGTDVKSGQELKDEAKDGFVDAAKKGWVPPLKSPKKTGESDMAQDDAVEPEAPSSPPGLSIPLVVEMFKNADFSGHGAMAVLDLVQSNGSSNGILPDLIDKKVSSIKVYKGPNYIPGECVAAFYEDPSGKEDPILTLPPGSYHQLKNPLKNPAPECRLGAGQCNDKIRSVRFLKPNSSEPCADDPKVKWNAQGSYNWTQPIPLILILNTHPISEGNRKTHLVQSTPDLSLVSMNEDLESINIFKGPGFDDETTGVCLVKLYQDKSYGELLQSINLSGEFEQFPTAFKPISKYADQASSLKIECTK